MRLLLPPLLHFPFSTSLSTSFIQFVFFFLCFSSEIREDSCLTLIIDFQPPRAPPGCCSTADLQVHRRRCRMEWHVTRMHGEKYSYLQGCSHHAPMISFLPMPRSAPLGFLAPRLHSLTSGFLLGWHVYCTHHCRRVYYMHHRWPFLWFVCYSYFSFRDLTQVRQ